MKTIEDFKLAQMNDRLLLGTQASMQFETGKVFWCESNNYIPFKGVFHYILPSGSSASYILFTEPFNCLLVVLSPPMGEFKILDTEDTELSTWDSLTYHDSREQ